MQIWWDKVWWWREDKFSPIENALIKRKEKACLIILDFTLFDAYYLQRSTQVYQSSLASSWELAHSGL